jgi:hypothetical protein
MKALTKRKKAETQGVVLANHCVLDAGGGAGALSRLLVQRGCQRVVLVRFAKERVVGKNVLSETPKTKVDPRRPPAEKEPFHRVVGLLDEHGDFGDLTLVLAMHADQAVEPALKLALARKCRFLGVVLGCFVVFETIACKFCNCSLLRVPNRIS